VGGPAGLAGLRLAGILPGRQRPSVERKRLSHHGIFSNGDARGDSIMQVFETKEAAIDAACVLVGKGAFVFEVGPIQEGHGGTRLNGAEIRRIFDERVRNRMTSASAGS